MSKDKKERESNIELLRMLAGLAVVVLHFNMYSNGLSKSEGINHELLIVLECIAIPSVNVFLIIAGYFNCKKTEVVLPIRLVRLEIKVIIVNMIIYSIIANTESRFNFKEMLKAGLPVNYFVTIYIAVMILAPYVNRLLLELSSSKQLNQFVYIVVALFSVYVTFLEIFQQIRGQGYEGLSVIGLNGNGSGYTFVNFMMCYIIGAWLRLEESVTKNLSRVKLVLVWVGATIAVIVWHHIRTGLEWQYCNIFVVIQAAVLVKLFGEMRIKNRIINVLAPASFTCFLINIPILMRIDISRFIVASPVVLFLFVLLISVIILFTAWIFDMLYDYIENKVIGLISQIWSAHHEIKSV